MIKLLRKDGTPYDTVVTPEDVVRRQSKGMGSDADVRRLKAALKLGPGPYAIDSLRRFRHGTATGEPVATYRFCDEEGEEH